MAKKGKRKRSKFSSDGESGPPGVPTHLKLVATLRGHTGFIGRIAWSCNGTTLASPSADDTIRLWDAETWTCVRVLQARSGTVYSVCFDPTGAILASATRGAIQLWDVTNGGLIRKFEADHGLWWDVAFDPTGRTVAAGADGRLAIWETSTGDLLHSLEVPGRISTVAFAPIGSILVSAGEGSEIRFWQAETGRLLRVVEGSRTVYSLAFSATGELLASGDTDHTVKLWEPATGRLLRTLEGHTGIVDCVAHSPTAPVLASRGNDDTVRLWHRDSGQQLAVASELKGHHAQWPSLAFHPRLPRLATVGSETGSSEEECDRILHIWDFNVDALLRWALENPTTQYVNAKVVLLGDTGVGKSGLSVVLNGNPFTATDSTHGRKVWTFQSQEVTVGTNAKEVRETLLWDLAGQPAYRVIHQLHLNEVAVALVVFDARSEIDPLAGVRHWERALRLAERRQRGACPPMTKFLVSARNNRGTVSVSKERLAAIVKEFGFDGYFETSAKAGWQIEQLRKAIEDGIPWDDLPTVSSSALFAEIKLFLLKVKETGRLVTPTADLHEQFMREHRKVVKKEPKLRDQFETCVGRLENRDLIRRLSFGGYVLLQPELLDAYASALVNAAKEEPDGLGSIGEDAALAGTFYLSGEQRIEDPNQEQLILHATVEELVGHDLALRESAADGRYLVFPSQFNRDYEDAPEPRGKTLAITFDGPVQSLYATLAVRLGHSGLFTTGRAEMWRNAAVFTAKAGGKCGLYLHEFAEARGRLIIFYDEHEGQSPSEETRFHFEEFVVAHARRRALEETVKMVRFFVCANCGDPVPDTYVTRLRARNRMSFECPCGATVSLAEPKERRPFASKVQAMERAADRQRDFETFVESARGETSTPTFTGWAGDDRVTLSIVFTDVVGATALGEELRDERWNEVRRAHFGQSRRLIELYKGREIKTIGDSFMAAFRSVDRALDYAIALQDDTGHPKVHIRAGIHIGPMHVEENDVFGGTVNFAARVVGAIKQAEIWLSERAKDDLDRTGAKQHADLGWEKHEDVQMKGFPGVFTLWSLRR